MLLSTDSAICEHDLSGRSDSWETFCRRMEEPGVVGDSDSGLFLFFRRIVERWPHSPWVIVQRHFDEAWTALRKFASSGPWQSQLAFTPEVRDRLSKEYYRAMPALLCHSKTLAVHYDQLERPEVIVEIWRHCLPGVPFNHARAEHISRMRVNVVQEKHPLNNLKLWQLEQPL